MTPDDVMEIVPCESAAALVDEMSPTRGRLWASNRRSLFSGREWIFRGAPRSDYDHPLRPSAFREDAFAPFIPFQASRMALSGKEQRDLEDHFVQYCSEADHAGIHVPSDRPELRDPRCAIRDYDPNEFPPINKHHMFALAQHYGMPTRLLDWSRLPLVGMYLPSSRSQRFERSAQGRGRSAERIHAHLGA